MHRSIDRTRPVTDLASTTRAAVRAGRGERADRGRMQRVLDAGRVVLAADTLGAAQHMFDQALAFVKQRVQFNRVIGSFQAVKHQFADMVTMLEPCRAMVWYAGYAQDALPDEARLTALQTKAHLGDVGRDIARMATEAHGGMGFTDLLGLHYWFKRIGFNRQMLGGPERCREEAARLQGWTGMIAAVHRLIADLTCRRRGAGRPHAARRLSVPARPAAARRCRSRAAPGRRRSRATPAGCGATARWRQRSPIRPGFCVDPDPTYLTTLRRINRLEDYHALKHHQVLIDLLERMLGGPILPHPRVLMRNIFPAREEFTTKAHQDFPNVQGTTEVYTAWLPLIDCPMEVGPLQIAAGSHTAGVYDFDIAGGAGGIEITDPLEGRWVSGDFAVGDVLLFHSMTVHKGVPNRSDRLRMSMDVRYQLVSEPFNIDNANPDGQPLSWDEVYADWRSDALQYYWQRLPLTLKPFDPAWFDRRDALGFALGEAGDPRARSVLQRIVARDADPEKRARAQRLLDALP